MYINPPFKTDEITAWDFVAARGFGTVVATDAGNPVAAHVPLLMTRRDGQQSLEFHVARANPLHRIVTASPPVLVIVNGPDAYISPDWYVSADQVPTWNYMAAQISGRATAMPPERAEAHVEAMSLAFEERLRPKKPWSTAKMTCEKLAMMLRAIVPMEITVDSIQCSFKLSQNKSVSDRIEAARMLDWRGGAGERGIADAMRRSANATLAKN